MARLPRETGDVPEQRETRGNKFGIFACRQPQAGKKNNELEGHPGTQQQQVPGVSTSQ